MKNIFIILLSLTVIRTAAQQTAPCWFDVYQSYNLKRISDNEKIIQSYIKEEYGGSGTRSSHGVKKIPVVVHIIHNGGSENISDAQIQSQIEVLNEDFRREAGTNGFGDGVDTEVEFCLAKISPEGHCTNGIIRVQSTLTNHLTYQRSQLKQLSYWDNTQYLNMYVVKSINGNSGIAGYSSFPGGPPDEDGIVVRHNYFGKTGTASATLGRTTTHEIAHWFGLYHTFNNGCGVDLCDDGDYVCDTPPVALPNFGCPIINSCSNDSPDVADQIENYCDYSGDNCKNMFTMGQKLRMHATLNTFRTLIWSESNLIATGCDSGYVAPVSCLPLADLTTLTPNICVGGGVTFYDRSLNGPSSLSWSFPGATPSVSTTANPTVTYSSTGSFPVRLIVTNLMGADTLEFQNYITVTDAVAGIPSSWGDGFENVTFPYGQLTVDDPDNGITWERTTDAAYEGSASARIQNLINTNYGQSDALMLPRIDFTALPTPIKLSFKWAYARSSPTYSDELIVLVSDDCGNSWTQKFYRTGSGLATGPTQPTLFIPDSTQWKSANIDLSSYSGSDHVDIKIVNVTDGGNALYIDGIALGNISLSQINELDGNSGLIIFPNPAEDRLNIKSVQSGSTINEVSITDMLGKELVKFSNMGIEQVQINVGSYANGTYIVTIMSGERRIAYKFIKR